MKAPQLLLLAATAVAVTPLARGFAEFARGEILLSTTARASYDSRVFGGMNPLDDYIFTLDPRLIYRREAGQLKLDSFVGTRINRYADATELNSEDFNASLRLRLPPEGSSLASGSFESSYDERTDVNYDVNSRLREKTFQNRLNANIPAGLKGEVILGGSLRRDQRYQFSDRRTWDGSAGFRYKNFLEGTSLELRYRRLNVETSGQNEWNIPLDQQSDLYSATLSRPIYHDVQGSITYGYRVLNRSRAETPTGETRSQGSMFGVNLNGPFLPATLFPKLDSSLSLGYQETESPGINDRGGERFMGSLNLGWHARERTRLFVDARRAVELSVTDTTVTTTGFSLGVNQSIGNFTTTSFSAGYEERDYVTLQRTDDVVIVQANAGYRITREWSASAEYRLRAANSNSGIADYSRHLVSLLVNYTF